MVNKRAKEMSKIMDKVSELDMNNKEDFERLLEKFRWEGDLENEM